MTAAPQMLATSQPVNAAGIGSTPWLGGSTVDYFYASTYRRINVRYRPETIERHESRLMAAAEKRHEAEYQGRKKWRAQYDRQRGLCAICQQPTPPEKMTRDHIQLACVKCNETKGDSMPPNRKSKGGSSQGFPWK